MLRRHFRRELGHTGWFKWISRVQPHVVFRTTIEISGWPRFDRPLRIAFLSDFHAGSYSNDIERLAEIITEAATFTPDLVLFGGDYVNMSTGGGHLPPRVTAALLARLDGTLGRFAVLGNHDYAYDAHEVAAALRDCGIALLDHERCSATFRNHVIDIIGLPDAHIIRPEARALLASLRPDRPTIILMHDPMWFSKVPVGPFLALAGHTHGGQIKLPGVGIMTNSSKAPLRWSHGMIVDQGRHLYVTAGLGSSFLPIRVGIPPEYAVIDVNGTQR
jgi:hypothetical protein